MPYNFSEEENKILKFWEENKIFEKSLEKNKKRKAFVFYDGPPFATGLPHYGHILAGTIKDVVPRYKTMKGFYVTRRFGWDCHGLPIENEIEKEMAEDEIVEKTAARQGAPAEHGSRRTFARSISRDFKKMTALSAVRLSPSTDSG